MAQLEAGHPASALALLQAAWRARPTHRASAVGLARAYLALGQALEAQALLRPLAKAGPPHAEVLTWLGWSCLYQGPEADGGEALAALREGQALDPSWSWAALGLGHALLRWGEGARHEALGFLTEAIALGHPGPEAHLALAQAQAQQEGGLSAAILTAQEALQRWPGELSLAQALAEWQALLGEAGASARTLALAGGVLGQEAHIDWAIVAARHHEAGAHEAAARAWMAAIEADPERWEHHLALGEAWCLAGEAEAAQRAAQAAWRLEPERPEAHALIAKAALLAGQPHAAVEAASAALRRAPLSASHAEGLGLAYLEAGEAGRALAAFELAARLEGPSPLAWLGQVWACIDLRRWGEALGPAQALTRMAPELVEGWELLAQVLQELGQEEGALEAMGQAHALAPEAPAIAYKWAAMLTSVGRLAEARAAIAKRPPPPERAWRELATRLRLRLGA